jgi:hypothetical protein
MAIHTGRELGAINKHVRFRNREAGESVVWYEFKPLEGGHSVYDDIYDEGGPGTGGRNYARGIIIPTIYVEEVEDSFRAIEDGRQPTQNLRTTILFKDALAAGLSVADEYNDHLNDIIFYDERYYKVSDYRARGRIPGEVILVVQAYEVFIHQEFPFDIGPQHGHDESLPWPTNCEKPTAPDPPPATSIFL